MTYCEHCHVSIEGNNEKCPLCYEEVIMGEARAEKGLYPNYQIVKVIDKKKLLPRMAIFIAILIISVCVLINILTFNGNLWFIYVVTPTLYLLLLVNHTILSKSHMGRKIILQVAVASTLLFALDYSLGFKKWSVNLVHPFLIIGATMLITAIIVAQPMRWRDYVGYIITMISLGFMPLILYVAGVSDILWPSAGAALYALLTLIGMFLFSDNTLRNDLTRRFHF